MIATLRELADACDGDERPECPIIDNLASAPFREIGGRRSRTVGTCRRAASTSSAGGRWRQCLEMTAAHHRNPRIVGFLSGWQSHNASGDRRNRGDHDGRTHARSRSRSFGRRQPYGPEILRSGLRHASRPGDQSPLRSRGTDIPLLLGRMPGEVRRRPGNLSRATACKARERGRALHLSNAPGDPSCRTRQLSHLRHGFWSRRR